MEIKPGRDFQFSAPEGLKPQIPAKPELPKKDPAFEAKDQISLSELKALLKLKETPGEAEARKMLAELSKYGYQFPPEVVELAPAGLAQGQPVLISTADGKKNFLLTDLKDVKIMYYLAKGDLEKLPPYVKKGFQDLKGLEKRGGDFYFSASRKLGIGNIPLVSEWDRTDHLGATLLLNRSKKIAHLESYGELTYLKNIKDRRIPELLANPPKTDPKKEESLKLLRELEANNIKYALNFEPPEDFSPTDLGRLAKEKVKELFLSRFTDDPRYNSLLHKEYLLNTLGSGGDLTLILNEGGKDQLARDKEGLVLKQEEAKQLLQMLKGNLTPEAAQFFVDFAKLQESGSLIFARALTGMERGALHQSSNLGAYFNLLKKGEMVALNSDGTLISLESHAELNEYLKTGKQPASGDNPPLNPKTPKTNLMMTYFVSPFDPDQNGIIEDLPLRASKVGSNDNMDSVVMRSDLPIKNNLLHEYLFKDNMEILERLSKDTPMSDPKTLANFVYKSLKEHGDDQYLRMLVAGHGGAEKGLLPDGEGNQVAVSEAMSVDNFAGALAEGLKKYNQENGKDRKIDNLILGSCLMGNSSFIYALGKSGAVKFLNASPEVLMGNDPIKIYEYLADPKTAQSDPLKFSKDMVEIASAATAFPGGKPGMQFADTFGSYDLKQEKVDQFAKALDRFFKTCTANPKFAPFIKEDIHNCPTYGINVFYNLMMDVDERDIIEVAERIKGDARINSPELKKAAQELILKTQDLVVKQEVEERYGGKRGPTLYLPVDSYDFENAYSKTSLLQETAYRPFMKMVMEAPLYRNAVENVLLKIEESNEQKKAIARAEKESKAAQKDKPVEKNKTEALLTSQTTFEPTEEPLEIVQPQFDLKKAFKNGVSLTAAILGGAVGAALATAILTPAGLILGARAGLKGQSIIYNMKPQSAPFAFAAGKRAFSPAKEKPVKPPATEQITQNQVIAQAVLSPMETAGEIVFDKVSYKLGRIAGRITGSTIGTITGAVGGALSGLVAGGALGGLLGYKLANLKPRRPEGLA